jgi:hypothetical protein
MHPGDVSFPQGRWPLLLWFSKSAQMFSKGLEILAPQSFKLRKEYIRKDLNAKVSVDWSALEDDLRTFLLASRAGTFLTDS